jgi:pullulanase/glycogen debranching enzyme
VIYETHLRGYTVHPILRRVHPGTYRGFQDKIPYLRDLGVNAVEFLPIQEFNEMEYFLENMKRPHLRNFWGYSTLAFFAPNVPLRHASRHGQQVNEFKAWCWPCTGPASKSFSTWSSTTPPRAATAARYSTSAASTTRSTT